jgi:hypothetical protein
MTDLEVTDLSKVLDYSLRMCRMEELSHLTLKHDGWNASEGVLHPTNIQISQILFKLLQQGSEVLSQFIISQ